MSSAWTIPPIIDKSGTTYPSGALDNERRDSLVARDGLTLITADTLRNRQTIASGGALTLRAGRLLQNEEDAELYAGGDLLIEGVDGGTLEVVRNIAGTIEAEGSLTLRAEEFHNEAVLWGGDPGGSERPALGDATRRDSRARGVLVDPRPMGDADGGASERHLKSPSGDSARRGGISR